MKTPFIRPYSNWMYEQTWSLPEGWAVGREDPHRCWDKLLLKAVGREVWGSSGLPKAGFFASEASAFFKVVQCIWAKPFLILLLLLLPGVG